jgi:hypothetical protein
MSLLGLLMKHVNKMRRDFDKETHIGSLLMPEAHTESVA